MLEALPLDLELDALRAGLALCERAPDLEK